MRPFKKLGQNVQIADEVFFAYPELCEIGDNVRIDSFCVFTTPIKLGNYVHIAPFVSVIGGKESALVMDDFSGLAAGCRVICGSDDYFNGLTNPTIPPEYRQSCTKGTVHLAEHCIAGTNTVIHPNVLFREGACTGSCTLVTKSLWEPWMVYMGVPAKRYKRRDKDSILRMAKALLESKGE